MANQADGDWLWVAIVGLGIWWLWSERDCSKYSSEYSCSYVEKRAEYEVWYWKHLERNIGSDETYIGSSIGIQQCEDNARAYAASIGEEWNYRAYICVLIDDGRRMEKHRNLG